MAKMIMKLLAIGIVLASTVLAVPVIETRDASLAVGSAENKGIQARAWNSPGAFMFYYQFWDMTCGTNCGSKRQDNIVLRDSCHEDVCDFEGITQENGMKLGDDMCGKHFGACRVPGVGQWELELRRVGDPGSCNPPAVLFTNAQSGNTYATLHDVGGSGNGRQVGRCWKDTGHRMQKLCFLGNFPQLWGQVTMYSFVRCQWD